MCSQLSGLLEPPREPKKHVIAFKMLPRRIQQTSKILKKPPRRLQDASKHPPSRFCGLSGEAKIVISLHTSVKNQVFYQYASKAFPRRAQDALEGVWSRLNCVLEPLGPLSGAPRRALGRLLSRPRSLKRPPRAPQEFQDASKTPQDTSKTSRKRPRALQDASKRPPRWFWRFSRRVKMVISLHTSVKNQVF